MVNYEAVLLPGERPAGSPPKPALSRTLKDPAAVGAEKVVLFSGCGAAEENGGRWAGSPPLSSYPPAEGEMAGELA